MLDSAFGDQWSVVALPLSPFLARSTHTAHLGSLYFRNAYMGYAIVVFVVSEINILLYFVALMLSHLTAFRIENNMCRSAMKCLMHAPLGLFEIKYLANA